jgi:FlaA1/EpsC-like NDP-sugar epimerase
LKEVGIREGEKIDEVMISKDDSRTTYEYDKHYIIYPSFEWWNLERHFTEGGVKIEDGFEYNSGTNKEWLDVENLMTKLKMLGH